MRLKWRCRLYLTGALAMTLPGLTVAQSPSVQMPRVGLLAWSTCDTSSFLRGDGEFGSFVHGLGEFGYRPGETVTIECRSAGERYDGLGAAAAELVRLRVDVIVTTSQPAGHAAHDATGTIPIISVVSGDPIAAGLARSLAKPGGNLTGVSYYATELTAKRLELLREAMPGVATVDVLANPDISYLPFEEDTKRAGEKLGIALRIRHISEPADLKGAFSKMETENAQAVFVLPDVMFSWEASRIASLALEHHLPVMAWGGWFTQAGCLMAYSAQYDLMNRRLAFYVDRILKGAKPGDLPIEQPTAFELSVNLKTAKALGLELPQDLLLRADELIE